MIQQDLTYSEGPDDLLGKSIPSLTTLVARRRGRLREFNDLNAPPVIIRREERMVKTAETALRVKVGQLPPIPEWLEGWPAGHYDDIPDGGPGSKDNPFILAPEGWYDGGVPYGAWCLCDTCNLPGRLTHAFDFFAKGPGAPLKCEVCRTLKLRRR